MSLKSPSPDRRAQMPFALVAVLLVVLAGSSVSLLALVEGSGDAAEAAEGALEGMQQSLVTAQMAVEEGALSVLTDVMTRHGDEGQEAIQEGFQKGMERWMSHHFPMHVGGHRVSIEEADLGVILRYLSLMDEAERNGSLPLHPMIVGGYRLIVSSERGSLDRYTEIERVGISPLPFLRDRMGRLSNELEGSHSTFAQMLTRELSSLAQLRAMQGWGVDSYYGPRGSSVILSDEDVSKAVEDALAVLEARSFRTVASEDPAHLALLQQSRVDPAALMLHGSWDGELDLSEVLARTLESIADTLTLQYMDYFYLIDLIRIADGLINIGLNFCEDFMGGLFGPEHMKAASYIRDHMEAAGYSEGSYRYLYRSPVDMVVAIPAVEFQVPGLEAMGPLSIPERTVGIDFPTVDIFHWEGWQHFIAQYRENVGHIERIFRKAIRDVIKDVAQSYELGSILIDTDPHSRSSMQERICDAVNYALIENRHWLQSTVDEALKGSDSLADLGLALASLVETSWEEISQCNRTIDTAFNGIWQHYAEALRDHYGDALSWEDSLYWTMHVPYLNDAHEEIERGVRDLANRRLDTIADVLSVVESPGSTVSRVIAALAVGAIDHIPGVADAVISQMERVTRSLGDLGAFQGEGMTELPGGSTFHLLDPDGRLFLQSLSLDRDLRLRTEFLGFANSDRNIHHVGFDSPAFSPYSCVIEILVNVSVAHSVASVNDPLSPWSLEAEHEHVSDFETILRIPVLSSWPLVGVEYRPSNTIGGDALMFCLEALGDLIVPLGEAYQAMDGVFNSLNGIMHDVSSFATDAMMALSEAAMAPLLRLQESMSGHVGEALTAVSKVFENMGVVTFRLDLHGLDLTFETNVFDLALGLGRNLVKITVSASVGDSIFTVSLQVMKAVNNEIYALLGGGIATDNWQAHATIDPLMRVNPHIMEVTGNVRGREFEIFLPQLTYYESFRVALSDIPGVGAMLSNIPLPVAGLKGSLDAGFEIHYNLPFSGNVVINEMELNPPGPDAGNEWVELYNPLDRGVDLSGWYITSGQAGNVYRIGQAYLPAGGHMIVRFPGQFLNNGGGANLPKGECAKLWDASDRLVDSTPWRSDHYNDGRTWQREYDGATRWVFQSNTMGGSNGKAASKISSKGWLQSRVTDAFLQSFAEYGDSIHDMDGVATVMKRTVELVADQAIGIIAESLVEARFFVRLGVSDISSAAEGGLELAVLVESDFVREGLRWIMDSIMRIISSVGNPAELATPTFLTEHVHLRLSAYSSIGPPRFLKPVELGMTVEIQAMIQMNMDALGISLGMGASRPAIGFGVVLRGLPAASLPSLLQVENNKDADLWLVRGSIDLYVSDDL